MKKSFLGLNWNIFSLGFVSFLTDLSSEMIFAVFSVFFTAVLGASAVLLGLVEGLADFAACSLDYLSGYFSDKTGKRKRFAVLGYGFSTAAKTLLLFVTSVVPAALFRVTERLGKSIRGAPRDAWIASLSNHSNRGYAFGLHKAFDKAGAVLGPLLAYVLLVQFGESKETYLLLFQIALVPAVLAVIVLLCVKEQPGVPQTRDNIFTALRTMSPAFKRYLFSAALFSLAYFSFGFLLLKAYLVGFAVKDIVLLYALYNVAFVLMSVPIGKLGDRIGRVSIMQIGYVCYALMCIGFMFAHTKLSVIFLFVLFGIFYAIDEGQNKAFISDLETRRGTAIGVYNFMTGLIYLPASLIAGYLWTFNPSYAFGFAALVSLCALGYFAVHKRDFSHVSA